LFCIAVAVLLGCFIVAKRVDAQGAPRRPVGAKLAAGAASAPASAALAPEAPASAASAQPPALVHAVLTDAGAGGKGEDEKPADGIETAVLGPDGGVPTHPEGRFRSPFANPSFGSTARVRVATLLTAVRNYDIKEGTFDADFYVSYTSDKPMPEMNLTFTNGKEESKTVIADKPTFKLIHYLGTFSSPVDLRAYPFDVQNLSIEIEDDRNGIDQVRLTHDVEHTNLDVGFEVPGWEVVSLDGRVMSHYYPDRFDHDDLYYSRYKLNLGIRRFATSAAFTVFVPAIVIVLISLSGLWLPRAELEVRSNASAPMLAAAVLFHFALMQELPATAYLTRADKVMLAVYVSLLLNMLATWAWFVFPEKYEETIFRWGRAIVPPITAIAMVAGSFL
jgi:hypothetical protein